MINKLRFKFVLITVGFLIAVFAVVFVMLNIFMQTSSSRYTEYLLTSVAEQDGFPFAQRPVRIPRSEERESYEMPLPPPGSDMMRAGRFFYVKVDTSGEILESDFEMMFDYTYEEAASSAREVLAKGKSKGVLGNLQYLSAEKPYGKIIVFAQRSIEEQLLTRLTSISIAVAGVTIPLLFAFSVFLSGWAVKPVKATFDKQRRFISDASHELKTPLTIISANADLLENERGGSVERIGHIKAQTERMGSLIRDLLTLARADEADVKTVYNSFDMSKAISNTLLEFESRAFEEGRELGGDIAEGICIMGDEPQIRQLASILLDNAIRHSNEGGRIRVALSQEGGRVRLSVYDTGEGIAPEEIPRIFDRFYRSDASRSRETGGYGLGLAIAQAIVGAHGGRIEVRSEIGDGAEFLVWM